MSKGTNERLKLGTNDNRVKVVLVVVEWSIQTINQTERMNA